MLTRPSIWLTAVLFTIFVGYSLWATSIDLRLFFALLALWVSLTQAEKSNRVLASVTECEQCWRADRSEYHPQTVSELVIVVRNEGLTLHRPELRIEYFKHVSLGYIRIAMVSEGDREGKLEKGMYARFHLNASEVGMHNYFLTPLTDGFRQKAYLRLYSQGYLAYSWRVGGPLEQAKIVWNRLARSVNQQFDRDLTSPSGQVMFKPGKVVPLLMVLESEIVRFAQSLVREETGEPLQPQQDSPVKIMKVQTYVVLALLVAILWWLSR